MNTTEANYCVHKYYEMVEWFQHILTSIDNSIVTNDEKNLKIDNIFNVM